MIGERGGGEEVEGSGQDNVTIREMMRNDCVWEIYKLVSSFWRRVEVYFILPFSSCKLFIYVSVEIELGP